MSDLNTRGDSAPLNLQSLLAVATIVGGIFIFSHKLSSSRTALPPSGVDQPLGSQTLERRLWEDPLSRNKSSTNVLASDTSLGSLFQTFHQYSTQRIQLLPVLVSGGSFSEDQENRIRSRFAIVSALGQSGYVPEDAEHIGEVRTGWPSTEEITKWKITSNLLPFSKTNSKTRRPSSSQRFFSRELRFGYEWYRARQFHPRLEDGPFGNILVLWLPENSFQDDPIYRLASFLDPFIQCIPNTNFMGAPVRLIGPWRSSTLRAMLSPEYVHNPPVSLSSNIQNVLARVALFSATSTASDEVLSTNSSNEPRESVKSAFQKMGFYAFHNFAATDDQLASEVLDELYLRSVDITNPKDHVVLISDWDTFYGRMLTLTYASEIERRQHGTSRSQYIKHYRAGESAFPKNYHYYSYLRGMDGFGIDAQVLEPKSDSKAKPSTVTDFFQWIPEANKSEGGAQFDYLVRLADRISDLEYELGSAGEGSIKAVGIAGSDVYDTLLVLQALRPRFPNVLFFTSDLDARFLSPKERPWTQNLIVTSGYGMELHPALQLGVAPFRDSIQTAQYAAAMAALGSETLLKTATILPRRFEIGRDRVVNLSTKANQKIHPLASWERKGIRSDTFHQVCGALVALVALLSMLFYYLPGFRRISFDSQQHQAQLALYEVNDVGNIDAVRFLLLRLARLKDVDQLALWVWDQFLEEAGRLRLPQRKDRISDRSLEDWLEVPQSTYRRLADEYSPEPETYFESIATAFSRVLNRIIRGELNPTDQALKGSFLISKTNFKKLKQWRRSQSASGPRIQVTGLSQLKQRRQIMDDALNRLAGPVKRFPRKWRNKIRDLDPDSATAASSLKIAKDARLAGLQVFQLRRHFTTFFWVVLAIGLALVVILGSEAVWDTYKRASGEPFSLNNGISAWPTEILRLFACLLSALFFSRSYYVLKATQYELTRKYRLPIVRGRFQWFRGPSTAAISPRNMELRADELWRHYQEHAFFPNRMSRAMIGILLFITFGIGLMFVTGFPLRPIRGDFLKRWDWVILWASIIAFLLVTFWTIHSVTLAQWFVEQLSEAPTQYPDATREHFSRERGNLHHTYLDEWIDVQLIADLTEAVGRLIYAPFFLFFILLLSRNSWWDNWGWTYGLVIIFIANLVLAAISVLVLQRAARKAKNAAERTLEAKVKQLQAATAVSPAQNNATQAERLLQEIRELRRGAFVPFWENPLVAAILVPSGGTVLLECILLILRR